MLTSPQVTAELIADGVHVDAAAIRILLAAKGTRGVILVSDGTAATGMPDGTYRLGTFQVNVSGGVCRSADGKLAGSTLTLDRALRNVVEARRSARGRQSPCLPPIPRGCSDSKDARARSPPAPTPTSCSSTATLKLRE